MTTSQDFSGLSFLSEEYLKKDHPYLLSKRRDKHFLSISQKHLTMMITIK